MGALLTVLAAAAPAWAAKGAAEPQVPGEALVQLTTTTALQPLLARYPFTLLSQFGARPIYRLKLIGNGSLQTQLDRLALEPTVLAAEPNLVHSSPEARKNVVWAVGTPAQYAAQWAPQALNLPAAHLLATGAGVRVAVLDTGVDTSHPALTKRLLPGRDFVDGDNDPTEVGSSADLGYGHGTHVAGLVALAAPEARIMPLRVLDRNGQGNVWVAVEALLHAVDPDNNPATNDGAHVINASFGTLERPRVLEVAIRLVTCALAEPGDALDPFTDPGYAGDKARCLQTGGAVLVAAAGNGGSRSEKQYPAAEGEYGLLPVGATAANGSLADFSNFGSWVSVAAPGDRITSTVPGGLYGTWSGTSMAAPLAAGVVALVRQRFPAMTAKEAARRVEDTAPRICDTQQGKVDALAALNGSRPGSRC